MPTPAVSPAHAHMLQLHSPLCQTPTRTPCRTCRPTSAWCCAAAARCPPGLRPAGAQPCPAGLQGEPGAVGDRTSRWGGGQEPHWAVKAAEGPDSSSLCCRWCHVDLGRWPTCPDHGAAATAAASCRLAPVARLRRATLITGCCRVIVVIVIVVQLSLLLICSTGSPWRQGMGRFRG